MGMGGKRTSCQHESMRTITSWPAASETACLVCIRKLVMHVLNVAVGKALVLPSNTRGVSWDEYQLKE